jgi:hypothetical protein
VKVSFQTARLSGHFERRLNVIIEQPARDRLSIPLIAKGHIKPAYTAIPTQLVLNKITRGQPVTRELSIRTDPPALSGQFKAVRASDPRLQIRLVRTLPGLLQFQIAISENAPAGDLSGHILFTFQDAQHPELQISVTGQIAAPLMAIPNSAHVEDFVATPSRRFLIKQRDGREFKITKVEYSQPTDLTIQFDSHSASTHLISVTMQTVPPRPGALRITTDLPDQATIEIPFVTSAK